MAKTPYGAWTSPITSEAIVAGAVGLGQIAIDGETVYWLEGRPAEKGRNAIVRRSPDGTITDVLPAPWNARTRVHEYGGGSFCVADGIVYFANFADQRLYRLVPEEEPQPLTPAGVDWRYGDLQVDRARQQLICVREAHGAGELPTNDLVSVSLSGDRDPVVLASGHDFYAMPRLSPDGRFLTWLTWDLPDMPWDATQLWRAEFVGAPGEMPRLSEPQCLAGNGQEAIAQPEWLPDGSLCFVSDRDNWWNLYCWQEGETVALYPMAAEFALPLWVLDNTTYAVAGDRQVACTYTRDGEWFLGLLDWRGDRPQLETFDLPYSTISGVQAMGNALVFRAASPTQPTAIVRLDLSDRHLDIWRQASDLAIDPGYLSAPEPITFPTADGQVAHGFFYPPQNRDYEAPADEKPPLLVKSHGGPTSSTASAFNLKIQYWTSRGFAVLDVNYRGSSGYGRAYRHSLYGAWGIADVEDCVHGARYLVDRGWVDRDRLTISGGSAGGYTTLCALTFTDAFKAGASHYGIGDLEALARDTHKFEARYLDRLIGPYPERKDLYVARSPIHHAERLSCPVAFFQGLEDKVVPPNQAERMVEVLKAKGIPVAYVAFPEEQHGFRRAENIRRALDGEFAFYARIFGIAPATPLEPIAIANLAE